MSVDPLFGKYADMGAYNYCGGNPVGCWDPDGRVQCDENGNLVINDNPAVVNELLTERRSQFQQINTCGADNPYDDYVEVEY